MERAEGRFDDQPGPVTEGSAGTQQHPGLADMSSYPLISALRERRTRRIARGTSIDAGGVSHQSSNEPEPLTPLEEAILIVASGVTGAVMHDGPLRKPTGDEELATPFMNVVARSASSPDNAQATSMFMFNDEGTFLIKQLRGREALELLRQMPPRLADWTEDDWTSAAAQVKHKLYDQRVDFPREWPYYIGWNKQHSNVPGSTVFFPVVDLTYQYINAFMILNSEPDGQRPLWIDDYSRFRPKTIQDWIAWGASKLGIIDKIPYHPIGGIKRARGGYVNPDNTVPLGYGRTLRTDHEAFFLIQNLTLVGEAMRLGGWIHASIFPPFIMQRDPAKGWYGLGFREHATKTFRRWPPLPAPIPNFVGIDGILEGICPPYYTIDEAIDQTLEMKYSASGPYRDPQVFGHSYRNDAAADAYMQQAKPYSEECVSYAREICHYIYDTYGRFPAHVNAFYVPGIWVQFSHLELEYYEQYAAPPFYERQARHDEIWHGGGG